MTAISQVAPKPSNNPLITSEEEHLRLIAKEVAGQGRIIPNIAKLIVEYANDRSVTTWHTALSRLHQLPQRIPSLHLDDPEILKVIYSIPGCFYLIPPGTLNALEAMVSGYGQAHLQEFGGTNPLQFKIFSDEARLAHGSAWFDKYKWVWMSDDVLEESSLGKANASDYSIKPKFANSIYKRCSSMSLSS
jgi:hypothetical protein